MINTEQRTSTMLMNLTVFINKRNICRPNAQTVRTANDFAAVTSFFHSYSFWMREIFLMVDLKTFQKLPFLMTLVVCSGWKNNSYQRSFSSMQCLRYILTAKSFLFRSRKPQHSMFKFVQIKSWGREEWRDRPINHVFLL